MKRSIEILKNAIINETSNIEHYDKQLKYFIKERKDYENMIRKSNNRIDGYQKSITELEKILDK